MLWRRDILDDAGGIEALGSEIAEDAAATKIVRAQGLDVRLVDRPFEQPLGPRITSAGLGSASAMGAIEARHVPDLLCPGNIDRKCAADFSRRRRRSRLRHRSAFALSSLWCDLVRRRGRIGAGRALALGHSFAARVGSTRCCCCRSYGSKDGLEIRLSGAATT